MANLAISDELFERLAKIASARKLPIERQAEEFLSEAVNRRTRRADLRRMFDEIAALTPKNVPQTDSVILLREDRDR
ncbi:MAG TPA: hypothetical protein VKB16_20680 [Beijerinckiaceae bacterium]|jgi:antitoxin FitA|nr:hypothetical protein [Beijerinckiaceae bacterium]